MATAKKAKSTDTLIATIKMDSLGSLKVYTTIDDEIRIKNEYDGTVLSNVIITKQAFEDLKKVKI